MAAANTDKLKKYKSLYSSTLSVGIGTGTADTITPATVVGLPTDTAITLTFDRVDSGGASLGNKVERITGVISGGNFTSYVRAKDSTTEQSHSGGAVIEMVWNAQDWNDMVDWGLVEHNQDGTHKSALVTTLKATGAEIDTGTEDAKIVTPKAIADSAVSTASKTQTLTNKTIVQKVTAYTPEAAATVTIDATTGGIHRITCPAGNFSITISNEAAGQCLIIEVVKDNSTTARTITFNDTVTWITSGGTQPTYTTTANGMTTFGLRCTGSNAFEGYLVGSK
jgi:hypothetical protein